MNIKPEVFISYSWDSHEHEEWVSKLYVILRDNGIEALIDRYEVFLGSNLENYMQKGLSNSRYVLCICTEEYLIKTNDPTTGVGKETEIIQKNDRTDFIIPIIKDNHHKALPGFLDERFYIDFNEVEFNGARSNDKKRVKELLVHIYNIDDKLKPGKGVNPFDSLIWEDVVIDTKICRSMNINPVLTGTVKFNYSNNNGEYRIGTGTYSFTTKWSKASDCSIHVYSDSSDVNRIAIIKKIKEIPPELLDVKELDFTSRVRSPKRDDGIIWLNNNGHFAITIIRDIKDDTRGDYEDYLEFDYKIYLNERRIS